jgi:hypothetical protein
MEGSEKGGRAAAARYFRALSTTTLICMPLERSSSTVCSKRDRQPAQMKGRIEISLFGRTYVQRHGGAFPAAEWIAAVYSPNPAGTHSKAWETLKRAQGGGQHPEFGRPGGRCRDR